MDYSYLTVLVIVSSHNCAPLSFAKHCRDLHRKEGRGSKVSLHTRAERSDCRETVQASTRDADFGTRADAYLGNFMEVLGTLH